MPRCRRLLVVPEYNEGRTIAAVIERSLPHVDAVVVVDDGSTDDSASQVRALAAAHPQIVLLQLAANQGMSGALLVGFCYAWHLCQLGRLAPDDWVVTIDADGQHIPEEIPRLVQHGSQRRADVVLGCRDLGGYPWFKRVGNWGLSLWASLLSGHRYRDVECGFRAMRVRVLPHLIRYFTGRRYGCAQEIAVITSLLGFAVDNTFPTGIAYYRPGARVRDGLTNLGMGFLAWARVRLGLAYPLAGRVRQVLAEVRALPEVPPL